jgi:DNA-binding response OmpR family regulator
MAQILVVDDEKDIRELLRLMLEADGYRVMQASDGREALPLAMKHPIDLIITDIRMPKLDGLTLCKALRQNKDTAHIPVLIVAGQTTAEPLKEAWDAGADEFLSKPFNPYEIKLRVRTLVRLKQAHDEIRKLRGHSAATPTS